MTLGERLVEHVRACFTGLWIESHEHEDALHEIAALCRQERWQLAVWDLDRGLTIPGQEPAMEPATTDPLAAIRSLSGLASADGAALLVLVNFHRLLGSAEMVQALAPLHRKAKVERVVVCTYQAVSGAGRGGIDELERQVREMFNLKEPVISAFDQRIAFNVLPRIPAKDPIPASGTTGEEQKMIDETRKILADPGIDVAMTCVRVPVSVGHSCTALVETERPVTPGGPPLPLAPHRHGAPIWVKKRARRTGAQ